MTQTVPATQPQQVSPQANQTNAPREVLANGVIPADHSMMDVPLARIRRNPEVDPRQHRNKARFASMLESFKRDGIIQPITLRPIAPDAEGGPDFEVVAGNTRFAGAQEIGLATIPALVRHVTAREAAVLAGVENMQRADLSPVEEGHHAANLLAAHNNDYAEVCSLLDWSENKLKSRVMLTHTTSFVQDALVQGDLKIGHVELLAGVPKGQQDRIASKIIEQGYSVTDAKERLANGTRLLAQARFPLDECEGCRFNSSTLRDMFATAEDAKKDHCSNAACWDKKTASALDIIVTDAKETYGTVLRENEVPAGSHVLLEAEGDNGVGVEQLAACTSCQHFGCIISTTFGSEGKTQGSQCFNLTCHAEKVTAFRTELAQAAADKQAQPEEGATAQQGDQDAGEGSQPPASTKAPAPAKEKKAPAPLTPATLKRGIKQEAMTRFQKMGEEAIAGSERLGAAIALLTLHASLKREYPEDVTTRANDVLKRLTTDAEALAPINADVTDNKALLLARLSIEELAAATTALAALTVWRNDFQQQMEKHAAFQNAARYAQARKVNRASYLAVTPEYLKAQTKAGITEDCKRSGFAEAYDAEKGDKAFLALSKGKAGDLIKEIEAFVAEGHFDFHGYEPVGFAPDFYFNGL